MTTEYRTYWVNISPKIYRSSSFDTNTLYNRAWYRDEDKADVHRRILIGAGRFNSHMKSYKFYTQGYHAHEHVLLKKPEKNKSLIDNNLDTVSHRGFIQ